MRSISFSLLLFTACSQVPALTPQKSVPLRLADMEMNDTTLYTCPGDTNRDHVVDQKDLDVVQSHLGSRGSALDPDRQGELNGDGVVDEKDLALVQANLGRHCPALQPSVCLGDLNLDKQVDFSDLVILAQSYNAVAKPGETLPADLNHDGVVNSQDLALLSTHYNRSCNDIIALPRSMASLGDSISYGFFSYSNLLYAPTRSFFPTSNGPLSWSTGNFWDSQSHYQRIRSQLPAGSTLTAYNYSELGAVAANLDAELEALKTKSLADLGQALPDYITLFIGANDLGKNRLEDMTPTAEFSQTVSDLLTKIVSLGRSRVLVVALPEALTTLPELIGDRPTFHPYFNFSGTCHDLWNVRSNLNYYPATLTRMDAASRAIVQQRLREYNLALAEAVKDANALAGEERVKFAAGLAKLPLSPSDMSADCFHPSARGQNHLAAETWAQGFFP